MTKKSEPKAQPVEHVHLGHIEVAIWQNTSKDGKTYFTWQPYRKYSDAEGTLKRAKSFNKKDIDAVIVAIDMVKTKLDEFNSQQSKAA